MIGPAHSLEVASRKDLTKPSVEAQEADSSRSGVDIDRSGVDIDHSAVGVDRSALDIDHSVEGIGRYSAEVEGLEIVVVNCASAGWT